MTRKLTKIEYEIIEQMLINRKIKNAVIVDSFYQDIDKIVEGYEKYKSRIAVCFKRTTDTGTYYTSGSYFFPEKEITTLENAKKDFHYIDLQADTIITFDLHHSKDAWGE